MNLGLFMQSLFFNWSHFLLAFKYRHIARTVPYKIQQKEPPKENQCQKVTYCLFYALVFIGPLIQAPSSFFFRKSQLIDRKPPTKLNALILDIGWDLCGVSEISSGIILVQNVWNIKQFFIDQDAEDYINLSELLKHAAAFSLYMFSSMIKYVTHSLTSYVPGSHFLFGLFLLGALVAAIGSFVAQCYLIVIFRSLSKKIEITRDSHRVMFQSLRVEQQQNGENVLRSSHTSYKSIQVSEYSIKSVEMTEYDEDADLQANLWNSLIRSNKLGDKVRASDASMPSASFGAPKENRFIITPEEITKKPKFLVEIQVPEDGS